MRIISRAGWGADEPSRSIPSIPLPVPRLVLHHTVTKDEGTSSVLKVQRLHMGQGFSDIGYNWVYSPRTREVYEGRGPGVVGAHTRGYNTTAHALALLGDGRYDDLSPDNISDLAEFRLWHGQYGPDHFTHGHRDLVATACPGANFYACIDQINNTEPDMPLSNEDIRRIADAVDGLKIPKQVWRVPIPAANSYTGEREWAGNILFSLRNLDQIEPIVRQAIEEADIAGAQADDVADKVMESLRSRLAE